MTQPESDLPTNIAAPARGALASIGVTRLEQLTHIGESELKKLHGMGPTGIKKLQSALQARGLGFAPAKREQGQE